MLMFLHTDDLALYTQLTFTSFSLSMLQFTKTAEKHVKIVLDELEK